MMSPIISGRPESTEHAPYYGKYIALVPEADLAAALAAQLPETLAFIGSIPESRGDHRYAPEKWSVREVLRHVIDVERVFGFRAFWFARAAGTALPGFEQDDFVRTAPAGAKLPQLAREFEHVRQGHVDFFEGLAPEAWQRMGIASDSPFSPRAIAAILVGHMRHHTAVLRERYF